MMTLVQTGEEYLKTHTADEIAELLAKGHPPFKDAVKCDGTHCRDCWLAWLKTGNPPK